MNLSEILYKFLNVIKKNIRDFAEKLYLSSINIVGPSVSAGTALKSIIDYPETDKNKSSDDSLSFMDSSNDCSYFNLTENKMSSVMMEIKILICLGKSENIMVHYMII